MDQVAKIANVGKGTIYTFYKNKEELFREIVQRMIEEMKYEAEQSLDDQLSFLKTCIGPFIESWSSGRSISYL